MTVLSRRNLIRTSILGAALAPFATARSAFAAATTKRSLYVRSRFAPLRQRRFTVSGGGHWSMRLVKVGNLPSSRRDEHRFALTFRCTRGGPAARSADELRPVLAADRGFLRLTGEGSYTVHRHGFTPTTLFLVPSDSRRRTYEAVVFNKP